MARIIAATSAEAFAIKYLPPVLSGLESWHFLNENLEKAARNYAPGKPNGIINGAPVVNPNFMGFRGLQNFIQTDYTETIEGTFFIVGRTASSLASDPVRPMYFGTFQSPIAGSTALTFGISITHGPAGIGGYASRGVEGSQASAPAIIPDPADGYTTWALYSLTVGADPGSTTALRDHTRSVTRFNGAGSAARLRSSGKFRIGSGFTTYQGECDMAFYAAYSRVLSNEEREATVANIRQYLSNRGITV